MTVLASQSPASSLMPSMGEWQHMLAMASTLVKSGFLPQTVKTAEQAVAIMLKGREINIPPMYAFSKISVINGKPSMDAELMLALIYRDHPTADIEIVRNESNGAEIHARRNPKKKMVVFKFEEEDAKRAGLLGKGPWQSYPKAMYLWRTVSAMARALFPEKLAGMTHTPEELGEDVNENGEVIDISPSPARSTPDPASVFPPLTRNPPQERKASIVDLSDPSHIRMMDITLKNRGVPDDKWDEIKVKMEGRPSTDITAVCKAVLG